MKTIKAFIFLIFALVLISACKNSAEPVENNQEKSGNTNQFLVSKSLFETTNMNIGQVSNHDFYDIVQATGVIEVPMSAKAKVSPMIAGFVSKLPFIIGDYVKKGALLFELKTTTFIQLQQTYLEAKAELAYLQSEFERQKLLAQENINSKKSFQKASSDYNLKKAQYQGLKETLELLHVDMNKLDKGMYTPDVRVYAPIDGYITDIKASIGSYVEPNEVLLSLVNTSHKHLELEVFEKDVLKIERGQGIRFRVPDAGNLYYNGVVIQVNKVIDMDRRTILVHGHLADENVKFLQGMYVEGEILTNKINGVAVPSRAVAEENGQAYLLRFQEVSGNDFVFEKVFVKLGRVTEQFSQIVSDNLAPGDKILDKGVFRLVGN
ncbi:MAG: efflux RND transporter periplasmic adaptor subunit [Bacteroidales bacterium]|nr:efflux RND transporter periplasmic adaptor subunit [Bacteroidales bacterium]